MLDLDLDQVELSSVGSDLLSPISELSIVEPDNIIHSFQSLLSSSDLYLPAGVASACVSCSSAAVASLSEIADITSNGKQTQLYDCHAGSNQQATDFEMTSSSFLSPMSITDVQVYTTNNFIQSDHDNTMTPDSVQRTHPFTTATSISNPTRRQLVCINLSPSCSNNSDDKSCQPSLLTSYHLPNDINSNLHQHDNDSASGISMDANATRQTGPFYQNQAKPFRESIYMLGTKVANNTHSPLKITRKWASRIARPGQQKNLVLDYHHSSLKEISKSSMRSFGTRLFHTVTNATLKVEKDQFNNSSNPTTKNNNGSDIDHICSNAHSGSGQSPNLSEVVAYMKSSPINCENHSGRSNIMSSPLDSITSLNSTNKLTRTVHNKLNSKRVNNDDQDITFETSHYQDLQHSPIERLKKGIPLTNSSTFEFSIFTNEGSPVTTKNENDNYLSSSSPGTKQHCYNQQSQQQNQDTVWMDIFDYASDLIWPQSNVRSKEKEKDRVKDKAKDKTKNNDLESSNPRLMPSRNSFTSMILPQKAANRLQSKTIASNYGQNTCSPDLLEVSQNGTPLSAELFDRNWTNISHSSGSSTNDTEYSLSATLKKDPPYVIDLELEAQHSIQEIMDWANNLDRNLPSVSDEKSLNLEPLSTWEYASQPFEQSKAENDEISPTSNLSHLSRASKLSKTWKRFSYQKTSMLNRIKHRPDATSFRTTDSLNLHCRESSTKTSESLTAMSCTAEAISHIQPMHDSVDNGSSKYSQNSSSNNSSRVKDDVSDFIEDSKKWLRSLRLTRVSFTHKLRHRLHTRSSEPSLTSLNSHYHTIGPLPHKHHLINRLQPYMTARL